ncbi:MAG TPA: serine hydrolase domain-containing protein, partial [Gemmatimonas sp.]|nr:serine hydrolase domain-containing protein [Gemmatimonas sp.]
MTSRRYNSVQRDLRKRVQWCPRPAPLLPRWGRQLASVCVVAYAATAPRLLSAQQIAAPDSTRSVVERVFGQFRGTDRPGCAVGIQRNGRRYEGAFGMANLETGTPITPTSIFHVASIAKQFTAASIMLLARDGKLSVDDDIRRYLPELPRYGTSITIRHLLTHTSGLRDQWSLIALARGRFEENRITTDDIMDIVARQRALNFVPGAELVYSNTGYTLLGVIVSRVSGMSLRAFAQERIFGPLGMTSTHFHDDYNMIVPGRTSAYAPAPSSTGWEVSTPNFDTYGATSLFTTVGDLLRWQENLEAPMIGDRQLFSQMESRHRLPNGDTTTFGFGLTHDRYRGATVIGHGGADAGYRSSVVRYPAHRLAIALACNTARANTALMVDALADALLADVLEPPAPEPPLPVPTTVVAAQLTARVGVYIQPNTRQVLEVSLHDGRLFTGRSRIAPLVPVAGNRFRVDSQPVELIFRSMDSVETRRLTGGRPVLFVRRRAGEIESSMLAQYAGTYVSEELDATYQVSASDSGLVFRVGTARPLHGRPVLRDL